MINPQIKTPKGLRCIALWVFFAALMIDDQYSTAGIGYSLVCRSALSVFEAASPMVRNIVARLSVAVLTML